MYWTETVKSGYTVNRESREKCAALMERIRSETPGYWPNGLDIRGFDDIYMVRKASDNEPVGFVGWQTRLEKYARVGYYSIGILPEYRKQGFAKQAVAEMLEKCAATVDVVRAFIMPSNGPSHALADSLGVPVVHKVASWAKFLAPAAGGVATAGIWDRYLHGNKPIGDILHDPQRQADLATNMLIGAFGGHKLRQGMNPGNLHAARDLATGISSTLVAPAVKPTLARVPHFIDSMSDKNTAAAKAMGGLKLDPKALAMIVGGGAIAGAGLVGANMLRKALLNNAASRQQGRVKVTLPTRGKGDAETSVDLPTSDVNISPTLMSALGRDTRRRLREESSQRKWKRNSQGRLITNGTPLRDVEVLDDAAPEEKAAYLNLLVS